MDNETHWEPPSSLEFSSLPVGARLLGDLTTLLIVRELHQGARRFNEIHRSMPALSRSTLVDRLRKLEHMGALRREPVPGAARHEYLLTPAGEALREVLVSICTWTTTWQSTPEEPTEVDLGRHQPAVGAPPRTADQSATD